MSVRVIDMQLPLSIDEMLVIQEYTLYRATLLSQQEAERPTRRRPQKAVAERLGPRRRLRAGEVACECPICMTTNDRKLLRTMPCCQTVHATCVDTWLGKHGHSNCPFCRAELFPASAAST